jgi:ribosomal protein L37E
MEEGFLLEMGDGNNMTSQTWVEGALEKSWFMGAKLKGRALYEVTTFRCTACGYLDSYALNTRKGPLA